MEEKINQIIIKQNNIEKELNNNKFQKNNNIDLENEKIKNEIIKKEKDYEEFKRYIHEAIGPINEVIVEFPKLENEINNHKKSLEKINQEINFIKEEQKEIKNIQDIVQKNDLKRDNKEDILNKALKEIEFLKKKIKEFENKENKNEYNIELNHERPKKFEYFKTISKDLFDQRYYNNKACIFASHCNDFIYIVYGNNSLDLECYNIDKDRRNVLIKKLHKDKFYSCRYYYNEEENKDLIITSSFDNHVKIIIFDIEKDAFSTPIIDFNFEKMEEENYFINTAYFINSTTLAVPLSNNRKMVGRIHFYGLNQKLIKEIIDTGFIIHVNNFYWKEKNKYFCLISNLKDILVYDLEYFNLYHKFSSLIEGKNGFNETYIIEKENKLISIGCDFDYGFIFFWNFETKSLINKMRLNSGISSYSI